MNEHIAVIDNVLALSTPMCYTFRQKPREAKSNGADSGDNAQDGYISV